MKQVRLLSLAIMAVLLLGCSLQQDNRETPKSNAILVIQPYRHAGTWVFDDPLRGLTREPFVSGIPQMIDAMVTNIPTAADGFRLLFSAQPFPGASHTMERRDSYAAGYWYYCPELNSTGWLCQAMFRYFTAAPKTMWVKAEKK